MAKTSDGMLSYSNLPLNERFGFNESEKKFRRALIRVNSLGKDSGLIGLVIPSWNPDTVLEFPWEDFPVELMGQFNSLPAGEHYRFHAQVNLGADKRKYQDIYIDLNKGSYELK